MFEHFSEKELQILEARAQQIAHDKNAAEEQMLSALRCAVGGAWYAIPLDALTAIYEGAVVVPVPSTPPFFKGIANVRGRILSVLALDVLLNMPSSTPKENKLVIVSHKHQSVALQVDRVDNVIGYHPAELEEVPHETQSAETLACLADGTLILDIEALLNQPQLLIGLTTREG